MNEILHMDAIELQSSLASGALSARDVASACLSQIEQQEPTIQAWSWLESDFVMRQAATLDEYRASGRDIGPLHGLPVAIKDIIDTAGIPTENGTVLDSGRVPTADAVIVQRLKQAGAIIMGKTVTAELAHLHPGKTRNPHNPEHTPGGSSSGSAAAVAARMVPLAIGTQTGGSVIRPASFCGVVGYKPTFGAIPRTGVLSQSPSLDTLGVFAQSVAGAALLAEPLFGQDTGDPASTALPVPRLRQTAESEPPVTPAIAFVRQPCWGEADAVTHDAFTELVASLGDLCTEVDLPAPFAEAIALRERVNNAEMAKAFYTYENRGRAQLSPGILAAIDDGKKVLARDYLAACDWPGVLNAGLDEIFERFDAIITPAAPGPAPISLVSTGRSIFNALWTFCGTPSVTIPVLETEDGLPIGVQIVQAKGDDARLLRTARWLGNHLAGTNQS